MALLSRLVRYWLYTRSLSSGWQVRGALIGAVLLAVVAHSAPVTQLPPARFRFRSYGTKEGLRNLAATYVAQDSTGFIWVATQDGVYRYDGTRFVRFGSDEGLPANYVTSLATGKGGELWVGTWSGVARLVGGRFEAPAREGGLPPAYVNGLGFDSQGNLWVANALGLFRGHPQGRFEAVPGWPGGGATALYVDTHGTDVYAASETAVGHLGAAGAWTFWPTSSDEATERVDALVVDGTGRLWARSVNHLFSKKPDEKAFRDESAHVSWISNRGFLSLDRSGSLWVPTEDGLYHRDGERWSRLGEAEGLPTRWIRGVFEDREGSLWVASRGVSRILGRGLWSEWAEANGLPDDIVWCQLRDRSGQFWVGTGKGLVRAAPASWQVVAGTERNAIRRVAQAPDGRLWMGGSPAEVLCLDTRTHRLRRFGLAEGVKGKRILSLTVDRLGFVWVATDGGGLLRLGVGEPRFQRVQVPDDSATERFSYVLEDSRARLWATGELGLLLRENGVWRRFTTKDGLRRTDVSYVTEVQGGDLWVAYFDAVGITRLRAEVGKLRILEHRNDSTGLTSAKTYLLGDDKRGRLWVGSGNGIDVLGPGEVRHIGVDDGLAGDDTDSMAFLAEANGDVFVGTSSGLSRYRGGRATQEPTAPRPVILDATLGGLPAAVSAVGTQSVPRRRNTLELRFSTLSFVNEGQVEHQVRLIGLEPGWRSVKTSEARYPSLQPGAYRFEVRSRLGGGKWSSPADFRFVILPAWWETWPIRLLGVSLVLAVVAASVRTRIKVLKRRGRELEILVTQRTHELAQANASLLELSLTDALTGLRNRRYLEISLPKDVARADRAHREMRLGNIDRLTTNNDIVFLMADIDHFKEVNDTYGHLAGDKILEQTAILLGQYMRQSDTAVRWGGEEFLVVALNSNRSYGSRLAERICKGLREHPFDLGNGRILRKTISVGFSVYPFLQADPQRFSWNHVVDLADRCLYAAKRSGRDAWVGVRPADGVPSEDLLASFGMEDLASIPISPLLTVETSLGDASAVCFDEEGSQQGSL